jgi:DNA ligase (NAD+)
MTRDEAKALAQAHGAKTADSVSKGVTLVVAGPGAGTKLEKARKLGINVVDEGAFLKRVGR